MTDLFTYGSLMFPTVWRIVVGKDFRSERAVLPGFAVHRVKGEVYPGIVEGAPEDRVNGLVYHGVDEGSLRRLDAFEGGYYTRMPVTVLVGAGEGLCHAYVVRPEYRHLLSSESWTADWFQVHGLEAFLKGYKGFDEK